MKPINKCTMKKREFDYYVGIDASKKTLDLAITGYQANLPRHHKCISNDKKGVQSIGTWLKELGIEFKQALFCMEFTGVYNKPVQKYLASKDAFLWMEMPVRIIRSMGLQRGKNDKVDAERIAMYALRHEDEKVRWELPGEEEEAIIDLRRLRDRLIKTKRILSVPVTELASMGEKERSRRIKSHSRKCIDMIETEIEKVEAEIQKLIKINPEMENNIELIKSIPGVGNWTALEMVCATDNFKKISSAKQLACYCGCAPFEHKSGTSVRGKSRVSHMANKPLKVLLTLAAVSVIKTKSDMAIYYQRKVAEGKPKMSVVNALRNKIIHRIVAVIDRQSPYVGFEHVIS